MSTDVFEKFRNLADTTLPFSDFLISPDEPTMIKNASGWVQMQSEPFTQSEIQTFVSELDGKWKESFLQGKFSHTYKTEFWNLRISGYFASKKPMLAVRRTQLEPMSLAETGLPSHVEILLDNPRGLVLISGATGAGKTTSMAAMVQRINETRRAHIVTIEDPIEYNFIPKQSVFSQREVGVDTETYNDGVRAAMRQSPDVIVIGEIRDRATAETALMAGESGHLVLASIHANSAFGAVQKMLQFFPGEADVRLPSIANCLLGVISQVLLPSTDNQDWVLAAEIMLNHKQQFSPLMTNATKFNAALEDRTLGASRSMITSLSELVRKKAVTPTAALRSVVGQGDVYDSLKKTLGL